MTPRPPWAAWPAHPAEVQQPDESSTSADRELLELAAKAAGLAGWVWDEEFATMQSPPEESNYGPAYSFWNPLEDDGDALRLAVKLRINLKHQQEYMGGPVLEFIEAKTPHTATRFPQGFEECLTDADEMAATRRAIVRAAADIAKGGEA